ncbi:MAG: hypothetical protein A2Z25_08745 [Planctomycetes bacterium RBG_16_55_9]|nr:MAG: hypothetical protein A2Z25_08745 [Planctomycetes bacterium RBG_16_55_9]
MRKMSAFLFAVLVLAILSCTANANFLGTVQMWNTGVGANEPMTVWGGGRDGVDVYAGAYMFKKTGGSGEGKLWSNGAMSGFCVELGEPAPEINSKYSVIPLDKGPFSGPMGATKADYISELWGRFYDSSWASGGYYSDKQNTKAAAFAAAIWEILYEDLPVSPLKWNVKIDGTTGTGGFYTNFGDSSLANSWLHTLDGAGPKADLRVLSHNGYQDYIVAVPEPTTVVLLGFGGVLSLLRRRRRTIK